MPQTFGQIKDAFSDYLSLPQWDWTYFITQTFDPRRYSKAYSRLCEHSWRFLCNRLMERSIISYGFAFAESHKSGLRHWHALVHVTPDLFGNPTWDDIRKVMLEKYGRIQINDFKPDNWQLAGAQVNTISNGVSRYLTKYVAKESSGGDAWWDFNGNISGSEADAGEIMAAIGAPLRSKITD